MLHVGTDSRVTNRRTAPGNVLSPAEFVAACHAFVRRQRSILLFLPLMSVAVAVLYLAIVTPKFTAEAVLLVDPKRNDGSTQSNPGDLGSAASFMDSQVEILKSETIALSIINTLQLTKEPEFVGLGRGLVGTAMGLISLLYGSVGTRSIDGEGGDRIAVGGQLIRRQNQSGTRFFASHRTGPEQAQQGGCAHGESDQPGGGADSQAVRL